MKKAETIEYRLFNSFENDDNNTVLELMKEAKELLKSKEITQQHYNTLIDIYS